MACRLTCRFEVLVWHRFQQYYLWDLLSFKDNYFWCQVTLATFRAGKLAVQPG